MSDSIRTSEDFLDFTSNELVEELQRRSEAMVFAMLVTCESRQDDDFIPDLAMSWTGCPHTCHGLAQHLNLKMARNVHQEYGT